MDGQLAGVLQGRREKPLVKSRDIRPNRPLDVLQRPQADTGEVGTPVDENTLDKQAREDIVKSCRAAIEESETDMGWRWTREEGAEALAFLLGDQWPEDVLQERELAGRPSLVINKLAKFLQLVSGEWRQVRPSIKVRPVDSKSDVQGAKVREGLIRAIEADSQAEATVYQRGLDHALANGWGWARVVAEYQDDDAFEQSLKIRLVADPFSVYLDPLCRRVDLSDCRYLVVTDWIPEAEFKRRWPDKTVTHVDTTTPSIYSSPWTSSHDKTVRIAEFWWREPVKRKLAQVLDPTTQEIATIEVSDHPPEFLEFLRRRGLILGEVERDGAKVRMALVSGSDVLWGPIDWPGRRFPFAPFMGEELVIDGHRYLLGLVQRGKDAQRAYNLARSYQMERMALSPKAQWVGPKGYMGSGQQKTNWEEAHKSTKAALEYDGAIAPQRAQPIQADPAFAAEMSTSTQDLKETLGIYDASLGNRSSETSGVAIKSRQAQGGMITSGYLDNANQAVECLGKIVLELLPYYYPDPRIVRIIGEDRMTVEAAGINGMQILGEDGQPAPTVDLSSGRWDVQITTGPSYVTKRQEAMEALMEFGKLLGPQVFMQMSDLVLQYADWPGSDEMASRLKQIIGTAPPDPEMLQRWAPAIAPLVQQMVQQALMGGMAFGGPPPGGPGPGPGGPPRGPAPGPARGPAGPPPGPPIAPPVTANSGMIPERPSPSPMGPRPIPQGPTAGRPPVGR